MLKGLTELVPAPADTSLKNIEMQAAHQREPRIETT